MYNLSHLYLPPSPSPIVFDVKTALQRSMRRWAFVEVVDFRRRMSLQAATRAQCSATLLRGPRGVKVLLVARVLRKTEREHGSVVVKKMEARISCRRFQFW